MKIDVIVTILAGSAAVDRCVDNAPFPVIFSAFKHL